MKDILVILAQTEDSISKTDLVYAIEKDHWNEKTRQAKVGGKRWVFADKVRVSYFRTFSKLIDMKLITKGYGEFDYHDGITQEGRNIAQKIIDKALEESERLNQLILNARKDPHWNGRKKRTGFNRHQRKEFHYCFETKCPHARTLYEVLYGR